MNKNENYGKNASNEVKMILEPFFLREKESKKAEDN